MCHNSLRKNTIIYSNTINVTDACVRHVCSGLLSDFGSASATSDLDASGTVDVNDLLALLSAFGSTCVDVSAPTCTLGSDCGGQVWNDCGSSCPSICGTPPGMCNMMCNAAYQCGQDQCWNEATGACEAGVGR